METDGKHKFYLHEATVKAAKELIIDRQVRRLNEISLNSSKSLKAHSHAQGEKITLEGVGEDINDLKKEQAGIKGRITRIEESVELILEIMQSRRPTVERV